MNISIAKKSPLARLCAPFACLFPRRKVEFANNFLEGTHVTGNITLISDSAFTNRYSIVILGSISGNCAPSSANTDIPLGICTDAPQPTDLNNPTDLDQPVNVALLGATLGTQKVILGGTVARGDMLQSNGDGTSIKLLTTTGTFYNIGRALMAGAAGDTIEFVPTFPLKVVNP